MNQSPIKISASYYGPSNVFIYRTSTFRSASNCERIAWVWGEAEDQVLLKKDTLERKEDQDKLPHWKRVLPYFPQQQSQTLHQLKQNLSELKSKPLLIHREIQVQ